MDELFYALSDASRRHIVEILMQGEQSVNDIVEQVGIAQSGVSRHLKILREAGFTTVRADGQRRLYALRPEPLLEFEQWLSRYRALWENRLDAFGAELAKRKKGRKP